jgi:GTP-binding protein
MFIDEAFIQVEGGKGGTGRASFFPGLKTGPSGGDGGKGGNVYVLAKRNLADLHKFVENRKYRAKDGQVGANFKRTGANGEDITIHVPVGTLFIDQETKESFEITDIENPVIHAKGGYGGKGNAKFATPTNRSPKNAQPGKPGQERTFKLVLKLIAYYGLIGLPNAGKSSLLNELTAANVKTAMYPFTTLEPNLGVFNNHVIADIPGLIEGASEGKGLGFKFLKHVEKVEVLVHCIASDSADIIKDYKTVMNELTQYNEDLASKRQIVLLTKTDLVDQKKEKQLLS